VTRFLLFMNVLSGRVGDLHYEVQEVQREIAQRLSLPLDTVKQSWIEVDMTCVRETCSADQAPTLPTIADTFQELFDDTELASRLSLSTNRLYMVVVVPALGHLDALRAVYMEATCMTDQDNAAVIVMWQEGSSPVRLLHVIPEPEHDAAFREALQQAQRGQ
jgi:hypothetical protein